MSNIEAFAKQFKLIMNIHFRKAEPHELQAGLDFLKQAAEKLKAKNINQWRFWLNPSESDIAWIKSGFDNSEFYFIENENKESVGMFRIMYSDITYWGVQEKQAGYLHSLVVLKKFEGYHIGSKVFDYVETTLKGQNIFLLRLDCNASNAFLCKYYENLGFKKSGTIQMRHALNQLYEKQIL
jgi:ribosomal protein S18 acetylase RimI-like enzyme